MDGNFTFGDLKRFIDSMSNAGVCDDTPVFVGCNNKFHILTGDDIYTDMGFNHPEIYNVALDNKRLLFIDI